MAKSDIIKQPNHILTARFTVSQLEKNIIYLILDQLRKVMSMDLNKVHTEQEIVIEMKQLDENRNYERIKKAVISLTSKHVEFEVSIPNGRGGGRIQEVLTSLVSGLKYEQHSEYLSFLVPSSACRFFCYLGGGFTTFQKTIAISLSSNYSKCMYELCCRWIDKGGYQCSIEEFRRLMQIDRKYKQISHLRTRVLEGAKKELQTKADVFFSFQLNKVGKKYESIAFKFHRNTNTRDEYRGVKSEQYIFVYNFLNRYFSNQMDSKALDYTEKLASSGKIDIAYRRCGRLDDDFTGGLKTKSDITNLLNRIILKEWGVI